MATKAKALAKGQPQVMWASVKPPFGGRECTRPAQTKDHLCHQKHRPVLAQSFRFVTARQQPAVQGPAGGGEQDVDIAHHKFDLQQLRPFTPAQHHRHPSDGQHRPGQLRQAHRCFEEQCTQDQHEHRRAGSHQGHVQGRGGLQSQVLQRVVAAHAQQTQHPKATPMGPQTAARAKHRIGQGQQNEKRHDPT